MIGGQRKGEGKGRRGRGRGRGGEAGWCPPHDLFARRPTMVQGHSVKVMIYSVTGIVVFCL